MAAKPTFEVRRGLIKVRVWRKCDKVRPRYTVTVTRLYRNGDVWKESTRFHRDDVPLVRLTLDEAYAWIHQQSLEKSS